MTVLDAEPSSDPGRLGFEYDFDDLTDAGVRLPVDQQMLWKEVTEVGEEFLCMAPGWVEMPTGYRMQKEPLYCWDTAAKDERLIWYPRLVTVRNDPAWWEASRAYRDVKRFPTLLGIGHVMHDFDWEDADPEPFRIWDLWPIPAMLGDEVQASVAEWFGGEDWMTIMQFFEADAGEIDFCDLAEMTGYGATSEHEHQDQTGAPVNPNDYQSFATCLTGERAWEEMGDHVLVTHEVDGRTSRQVRFPGEPRVPPAAIDSWQALLASSRRNSAAAMGVYPPWDRDEALIIERRYNPWLWSF